MSPGKCYTYLSYLTEFMANTLRYVNCGHEASKTVIDESFAPMKVLKETGILFGKVNSTVCRAVDSDDITYIRVENEEYYMDAFINDTGESHYSFSSSEFSFTYVGNTKCALPHGEGKLIEVFGFAESGSYDSGDHVYTGHFDCGIFHGIGELKKKDKTVVSDFCHGKLHGYCKTVLDKGITLHRYYKDDKVDYSQRICVEVENDRLFRGKLYKDAEPPVLRGIWIAPDGAKRKGETTFGPNNIHTLMMDDASFALACITSTRFMIHGHFFTKDFTYHGDFKDELPHGFGKIMDSKHMRYEGEFKNSKYHGKGKLVCPEYGTYEGRWRDGKRHGYGVEYLRDESTLYKGYWKFNVKHGKGTVTLPNSTKLTCLWMNNNPFGSGEWLMVSGTVFKAKVGHYFSGEGTLEFKTPVFFDEMSVAAVTREWKNRFQKWTDEGDVELRLENGVTVYGRFEEDKFMERRKESPEVIKLQQKVEYEWECLRQQNRHEKGILRGVHEELELQMKELLCTRCRAGKNCKKKQCRKIRDTFYKSDKTHLPKKQRKVPVEYYSNPFEFGLDVSLPNIV